jgi:hypothetical protein
MAELARTFVSRLRQFFGDRRGTKRQQAHLPFSLSLASSRLSRKGSRRVTSVGGHTLDISTTGIALVVPAIRIGEHYLVADNRRLEVTLELPVKPIEMGVIPVRYESLEEHETEIGYLIGARITDMSEEHRSRFNEYIRKLLKRKPIL